MKIYTDEWNGFQFRSPNYIDGHFDPYRFDLVKWEEHEPMEVINVITNKKELSTRSCFSIGTLIFDPKDQDFEFKSCGLRYLEYRIDGLEQFILDFCAMIKPILMENNNDGYY